MVPPIVFLDACVLYPPLARTVILGAAEEGLFVPRWSGRVIAEWRFAAARKGGPTVAAAAEETAHAMAQAFPGGKVTPERAVEMAVDLPDPADAHVLAGAVAAGAGVILTFNLRDFPARALAAYGVAARHPDGFLWELMSGASEAVDRAVRAAIGEAAPAEVRRALKRARLARLGKAWVAMAGGPGLTPRGGA